MYNFPQIKALLVTPALTRALRNYFEEGGSRDDGVKLKVAVTAPDKGSCEFTCKRIGEIDDNPEIRPGSIMRQNGVTIPGVCTALDEWGWGGDIAAALQKCAKQPSCCCVACYAREDKDPAGKLSSQAVFVWITFYISDFTQNPRIVTTLCLDN